MKLILICLLGFVALSVAVPPPATPTHSRGCIYALGRCVEECPEGTHVYVPAGGGGCGYNTPEATCDQPNPIEEQGQICDYSACYCDPPTVRETNSRQCVLLENCPQK